VELLERLGAERLQWLKAMGFSDVQLSVLTGAPESAVARYRLQCNVRPVYKTVDTCAAEFESQTPYHYSTYAPGENEATPSRRPKVVILGSGPNRIGQGIEFDYCCVQGILALRRLGYEAIMINCNPETVSTDYDIVDKLYFEPLTFEDVRNVLEQERPDGIIVTLGGQTPLKLAHRLQAAGFRLLGTAPEGIDIAEDRERFARLLEELRIPCPPWGAARSEEEAVAIARRIGYPVLVRPSYVLGGRAMQICYREETLRRYLRNAFAAFPERPVLIDRFLEHAYEFDVDAVCDGDNVLIAGVLQHIEEAGIHSGDSTCVLPPYNISREQLEMLCDYTRRIARALNVVGPLNIQYALQHGTLYVLEANPRASRTMPFVAKATGIPIIELAIRAMLGEKLQALPDFRLDIGRVAVKESIFPFTKFPQVHVFPGPEMRSTGEVMGIDTSFGRALIKAHIAAGNRIPTQGGRVFFSLADYDKTPQAVEIARGYLELGFELWATPGTAAFLQSHGLPVTPVRKHYEGRPSIIDYITDGKVDILINTPLGENARYDEHIMGRIAMRHRIPFFTTLAAAAASLRGLAELRHAELQVKSLQEYYAE
jgi:carbamoyl-phosphate synthase large subunit